MHTQNHKRIQNRYYLLQLYTWVAEIYEV
jgi:hypothetical protein